MDMPRGRQLTPLQRRTAIYALQAGYALSGLDVVTLAHRSTGPDGEGLVPADLAALLNGGESVSLTAHQFDVLAQTLNDHFLEHGLDQPVIFSDGLDVSATSDGARPDHLARLDPHLVDVVGVEIRPAGTLGSVQTASGWWTAMRRPVAVFLRYVLDQGDDAAPTGILGTNASQAGQQRLMPFARAVHRLGFIEPTMPPGFGPEGDLGRVRVTCKGRAYLVDGRH